ncbi:hypothetical protein V5F32_08255 [Xanthobacter oligotrophicus]|uniref:Uncharacterized protein n=1 Tax=Xanthobacter oligotrophicus TaxID=2607286 RepID=A0ABW6ZWB6_9HYPH
MSSAIATNVLSTFAGEGRARTSIIILALVAASAIVAYIWFPAYRDALGLFDRRHDAIYSSAFTFLSILWAALLTVWSLLKSRATRYIERLSDNATFKNFMGQFEGRLVFGFFIILASFFIYIYEPIMNNSTHYYMIVIWAFVYSYSIILLLDSLMTSKIVLD